MGIRYTSYDDNKYVQLGSAAFALESKVQYVRHVIVTFKFG